jgi:hypothetical protein
MAVVWRMVCGEMWRSRRLGTFGVAAATASASRWATLVLVIVCPSRLGSSADAGSRFGLNLNHDRTAFTVERHSGIVRCLRPLPCRCTQAAPSSTTSAKRTPMISDTRAPVL